MWSYIIRFLAIMLMLLPIYLVIRRPWREKSARAWAEAAFVVFMGGLLTLTLQGRYQSPAAMAEDAMLRIESGKGINLVPFRTVSSFIEHCSTDIFLVNIVGNIVMFIPWGFGLPLLWKKQRKAVRVMRNALLLPIFIEACQLFIGRSVDVDDVILNFAGGCIGAALYFVFRKAVPGMGRLAR
ncbi:MAG: VanZ family protein [Acetatifactor sp.]